MGRLYFHGWGTAVDYAQTVQWLERNQEPEYALNDLLGICYLLGYGWQQDPARGKACLGSGGEDKNKLRICCFIGIALLYLEEVASVNETVEKFGS